MLCSFPRLPRQRSPAITVLGPAGAARLPCTDMCWGMPGHKCVCQRQGKKSVRLFAASSIFPQDGGDISAGVGGLPCPAGTCHKHRDRCVTYRCVTHCCLGRWAVKLPERVCVSTCTLSSEAMLRRAICFPPYFLEAGVQFVSKHTVLRCASVLRGAELSAQQGPALKSREGRQVGSSQPNVVPHDWTWLADPAGCTGAVRCTERFPKPNQVNKVLCSVKQNKNTEFMCCHRTKIC